MIKKHLFIGLGILALSACDTLSDIKIPDMSTLNPFNATTQADTNQTQATQTAPAPGQSATDIEMAEMQKLMGTTPRYAPPAQADMIAAEPETPAPDAETPIADTPQDKEVVAGSAPTPTAKPNYATQPEAVAAAPVDEQKTLETQDTVTEAPSKTAAPVLDEASAPAPAPAPVQEQEVTPVQAVAPTPATTSDIAMFNDQDLKLSSAKGCPQIEILPAGRSITYFEGNMTGQLVARAVINEIRGGCEIVDGGLEIDMDIFMDGKITDKGRFEGNRDQEAFMTFPYFVAVSDPNGLPVDKKIMATAMRFKPVINDLKHAEKITQFVPMDDTSVAANYKILVGFQLNRKQLEYNRARALNRVDNNRISRDTMPAARRSVNPLAD